MPILFLQRNHKTMEIDYYKVRAELKEQYKGFFKNIEGNPSNKLLNDTP